MLLLSLCYCVPACSWETAASTLDQAEVAALLRSASGICLSFDESEKGNEAQFVIKASIWDKEQNR
jgi:hypothetical protein